MSVVADYPDYSPHVAHANQIAATGVPLLTGSAVLYSPTGQVIAGGAVYAPGPVAVGQIGYEVWIQATIGAAATIPFLEVQMEWIDTVSGRNVATDTFIVPAASSAGGFVVAGRGPTKANSVALTVQNLDRSVSVTINMAMLQNSRIYPKDAWQWEMGGTAGVTVPGFTLPTLPNDQSVLGMLGSVTVGASASLTWLFGMHNGMINVGLDQDSANWSNVRLKIAAAPPSAYVGNNPIWASINPPTGFQIAGPHSPVRVVLTNSATTPATLTMSMIAAD